MNREMRRLMEREERRQKKQEKSGATARRTPAASARPAPAERKPLWQRIELLPRSAPGAAARVVADP